MTRFPYWNKQKLFKELEQEYEIKIEEEDFQLKPEELYNEVYIKNELRNLGGEEVEGEDYEGSEDHLPLEESSLDSDSIELSMFRMLYEAKINYCIFL